MYSNGSGGGTVDSSSAAAAASVNQRLVLQFMLGSYLVYAIQSILQAQLDANLQVT